MSRRIILASKSPRRKALLEQIGLEFEIRESEYAEDMDAKDDPRELAKFLALKKAEDVARHYDDAIVIAADSIVIFNNAPIGKPKSEAEARGILKSYSGKENIAVSGFAVIDTKSGQVVNGLGEAKVRFRELSEEEINDYIATGEPLEMAGAYGLMNKAAVLIEKVDGDFYSVVGLPLNQIYSVLKEMGADVLKN